MTTTPDPSDHPTDTTRGAAPIDPLGEATEADVAEQQQALDGGGTVTEPVVTTDEANEADALEQGATVTDAADEDAWPRATEGGDDRG